MLGFPAIAAAQKPYFQQEVNFRISVSLDDKQHRLTASEEMEYINHSPDTLWFIYMHIWPNAYKNNHTALAKQLVRSGDDDFQFCHDSMRGWIDGLDFSDETGKLNWNYREEQIDVCIVYLRNPLPPGASVKISTPFVVQLPGDFSRMGHVGQSYQVSQWFPKPAVYDREGWHAMPYLNQGEFYSEFGRFEVKITLPALYKVAATGELQEKEEKDWLEQHSQYLNVPDKEEVITPDIKRVGQMKTITFIQDRVHDFAWFCSKEFMVRKDEIQLASGRKVSTWAFFERKKDTPWLKGATYVKQAVKYYSQWVGEYPYSSATAVEGALSAGGGMEYPMVTVISAGDDGEALDNIITHEVGHNWFYGILASNERKYAWLDEGFNSFIEHRYMNVIYPKRGFGSALGIPNIPGFLDKYDANWNNYLSGTLHSSYGVQRPINTPSEELPPIQYAMLSYSRTAFLLDYLMDYLGEKTFDACMHAYFDEWKFRHPQPEDVKAVFERVSGKDLSWFFTEMMNTEKQMDYALSGLKKKDGNFVVDVKNKTGLVSPYSISLVKDGKVVATQWFDGHEGSREQILKQQDCDLVVLDYSYHTPDLNLRNNSLKTKGVFKKMEPLKVSFLTGFTRNDSRKLNIFPAIALNSTDKIAFGAMFHNLNVQGKRFNYFLMPMYSVGDKTLVGNFILKYDWFVYDACLYKVRLMMQHKRFAAYDKVEPSLNFFFHSGRLNHKKHWVSLSQAWIWNHDANGFIPDEYQVARLRYVRKRKSAILNEKITLSASMIQDEANAPIRFEGKYERKDQLSRRGHLLSRVYVGYTTEADYYFGLYSAGSPDISKDYYLIDRANNGESGWVGTHQRLADQGAFTIGNAVARDLLMNANLEYRHKGLFLNPYVRGLYLNDNLYYETGVGINLGILNLYLPVASNVYADHLPATGKEWADRINFVLEFNFMSLWNELEMQ